ncbi:hypothetical protein [Shimia sp.]|uniref:hypothetical protein n=1 Tax=Shimia sp. TaxID=1954381 RepID=UPI003B8E70C4
MTAQKQFLVYLDHRVLSELRKHKKMQPQISEYLQQLTGLGAVFVVSHTSLLECYDSGRPLEFAEVLEQFAVKLLAPVPGAPVQRSLKIFDPVSILLGEESSTLSGLKALETFLQPMQYTSGWLKNTDQTTVQGSVVLELDNEISNLMPEIPRALRDNLSAAHENFLKIDLDSVLQESLTDMAALRKNLPANYAQLDELSPIEAVDMIIDGLPPDSMEIIRRSFPKDFWSEKPKAGDLVGFSFLLFNCGLTREPKIKKGNTRSKQYYKGQYRDCCHIEEASYCQVLLTFDSNAKRLADAVYSYAGIETQVGLISHDQN